MNALRVAIIGAGGQIGRTLLRRLASEGSIEVRGICRNELTAAPLRLAGFDVRCGAVSEPETAQQLLGDCDVMVNCASATALPGTARREERGLVQGLLGVHGPRRLVHFSSVAAYGTCITAKNSFENPRPDHPYGREKLALERHLKAKAARSSVRELLILRMGHVYGAEQWVSRFVFDQLQREGWRLPFDGRLLSNAVHVTNVASAVLKLVSDNHSGTLNLFDCPQSTWREVFDWNTNAIDAPRMPGLDDASSEKLGERFASIARGPALELLLEVAAWGRSLPMSLASSSQQVRFLVMNMMAALQSPTFEAHLFKRFIGEHLARRSAPMSVEQSWLFSQPAPGPCVQYNPEIAASDANEVARWHQGYSNPDALASLPVRAQDGGDLHP